MDDLHAAEELCRLENLRDVLEKHLDAKTYQKSFKSVSDNIFETSMRVLAF